MHLVVAVVLLVAPVYALVVGARHGRPSEDWPPARARRAHAEIPPARSVAVGDPRYWAWYEHDRSLPCPSSATPVPTASSW